MLTREQIFDCPDLVPVPLLVPEWGGSVLIARQDGEARDAMDKRVDKLRDKEGRLSSIVDYRAAVVAHVVIDEHGCRVFADDDATLARLKKKSIKALERIARVAGAINAFGDDELEQALKNCGIPHGCDSGSSLPTDGDAAQQKSDDESVAAT